MTVPPPDEEEEEIEIKLNGVSVRATGDLAWLLLGIVSLIAIYLGLQVT